VITSISYDHTRQLGNTLVAIAAEKAGIIKPQVPVVSGVVSEEPRAVIRDVAQHASAPLWERERDFTAHIVDAPPLAGPTIDYRDTLTGTPYEVAGVSLNLPGEHQAANAAAAIAAIRLLTLQGWNLSEAAIRQGLSQVRCPARVEIVRRHPTVVLDSAHNVASVEALCQALRDAPASKRVLVFATSRDKDLSGMLRILLPAFDEVIVTCYQTNPRARTSAECFEAAQDERTRLDEARRPILHEAEEPLAAWQLAHSLSGDDGLVCITGSFFLAAELRSAAR
jgi:dihydrofolate synthase/folylpolyglutamate synthase